LSSATVWRNVYFGAEPEQRAQCLGLLDQQSALRDAPLPASYRLFELKDRSSRVRSNSSSAGEAVAVDVALDVSEGAECLKNSTAMSQKARLKSAPSITLRDCPRRAAGA
jgi:hypothetical protein